MNNNEEELLVIEERHYRHSTSTGVLESCWNCKHKMGSPICKEEVDPYDIESNWCTRYVYHGEPLVCVQCGKCNEPKKGDECPIVLKKRAQEDTLMKQIKDGEVKFV